MVKIKLRFVSTRLMYNMAALAVFGVIVSAACTLYVMADESKTLSLFEDFDQDGLSNGEEHAYGTDPHLADTDGDGYSDGVEVESGFDPLKPAPGDKIIKKENAIKIEPVHTATTNITQRVSESFVTYLADRQEAGVEYLDAQDFSDTVSKVVDEQVQFLKPEPMDIAALHIKNQDYDNMSSREKKEHIKQDTVEYFTSLSYIFINTFPPGYFDRAPEEVQKELSSYIAEYSTTLTSYGYFEDMARRATEAQKQMQGLTVPESLLEIHAETEYLLRFMEEIYKQGDYKKVQTDSVALIATLAQVQALLQQGAALQTKIEAVLTEQELPVDSFLQL